MPPTPTTVARLVQCGIGVSWFSAGISFDRYQLTAFVKNAFDEDKVIQHPQVASIVQGYRLAPRSIGVSIAAKW